MKKKWFGWLCALVIAIGATGCFFYRELPSSQYDLTTPETMRGVTYELVFRRVQNLSPTNLNMLYWHGDGKIQTDFYNYWAQSPDTMLRRYMLGSLLPDGPSSRLVELDLTVFDFKIDLSTQKAMLGVSSKLKIVNGTAEPVIVEQSNVFSAPYQEATPAGFARAMTQAAAQWVENLDLTIGKYQKK